MIHALDRVCARSRAWAGEGYQYLDSPESAWLAGTAEEASRMKAVTRELVTIRVSTHVNNVRHDDEACIAPMTKPE